MVLIDLLIQHFFGEIYILGYMTNPHRLPNLRYLYKLVDFSRKHCERERDMEFRNKVVGIAEIIIML